MTTGRPPKLHDTKSAAKFIQKPPGTLVNWRWSGRYRLPFIRVGRSIRYLEEDLIAFLESGRVASAK
jgi:helix-turn-helix protein